MRQTRAVVELAASAQLCVEGELGHLADAPRYDQAANADMMTQPTDVEPFIAQTGIDLLAVSVGTAHGMYAPGVVLLLIFSVWRRFSTARACLWHYMAVAVRRSISSSSVRRWG